MRTIVHHTALARSGGAARIGTLLYEGLEENGYSTLHSFEASENTGDPLITPQQAARAIPENAIVHLHSSASPAEFINSLPPSTKLIITLHDTAMITGGCINPLDCPNFDQECRNPCPRNYPDSENVRKKNIAALMDSNAIIISPSGWLSKLAKRAHNELSVKVIPNGIPWPNELGSKSSARKEFGIHPSSRVVLFIAHGGQEAAYKSGPQWSAYWEQIKANVPDAIGFAIGGDKNERHGDFIKIPYVDRQTLGKFMTAADVFAYPTLADNHPLLILEAMAHGLAAVSYAVGGIVEQITNGVNGILIPPYEKNLFADNVAALLAKPRSARELGANGFYGGKDKYNNNRMLKDYIKIYDKLV